jgi:hypothetical protein
VEAHASITEGFTPTSSTLKVLFESPIGGSQLVMAGPEYDMGMSNTYEVALVTRTTANAVSAPSARVQIRVGQVAPMDIPDFALTVRKFQSLTHQLY